MKLILVAASIVALAFALPACSKRMNQLVAPNHAPEVSLDPVASAPSGDSYRVLLRWKGSDFDGRVHHYVYAVDPASVDRVDATWRTTTDDALELRFPSAHGKLESTAGAPHVFAIRAVDDRGAMSEVKTVAMAEGNQPPTVTILSPPPSALIVPLVPPTLRISWRGFDPDPVLTSKPVKYKFILLGPQNGDLIQLALQNPDSLRRRYAPAFAGWDSTGKDSTALTFTNLLPNAEYLFVVIAYDELGAYSPVFSLNSSMLRFRVGSPETLVSQLTVFNEFFQYTSRGEAEIVVEVGTSQTTTLHWFGHPPLGDDIVGYRWVVDPSSIDDPTPRTDPSDVHHWSARSLGQTSATVGPFGPQGANRLYIEVLDTYGIRSLFTVRFSHVPVVMDRDLLIVDDTRLRGDNLDRATGCSARPLGSWPTAAELDTFLYARGGYPWRCYPTGTISSPGLFRGYSFDTIGTRGTTTVPLTTLGHYRHVIWIIDALSASYSNENYSPVNPQTVLRPMSGPNRVNTLAQYAAVGGRAWLVGGGGAFANLINWNDPANDVPTITFSSAGPRPELAPGRMMFDQVGWRSELRVLTSPLVVRRFGGRLPLTNLPQTLELKTTASDPMPPNRTNPSDFYHVVAGVEFLEVANPVAEGGGSTLDTLYDAIGAGLPVPTTNPHNVVMTRYHGSDLPQGFVFSGFDLWSFQRAQSVQLVDYVLQDLWGLNRSVFVTKTPATPPPDPVGHDPMGHGGGSTSKMGH